MSKPTDKIDYTQAIKQKCTACVHFKPQEGSMGYCAVHEALRPDRFWCDRWTDAKKAA